MADIIQTREVLKEYFQTGDIPTEPQYRNLIESLRHVHDKIPLEGLNLEGYDEEGEKDNNLYVRLGDFFNASNGTKIIIDDTEATISFKGKLKSEDDIEAIGRTITAGSFIGDGSQLTNIAAGAIPLNVAYTDTDNEFIAAQTIVNSAPAFNLKDANATSTADISGYLYFRDSSNTSGAYLGMANDNLELWSRNGEISMKGTTQFHENLKIPSSNNISWRNAANNADIPMLLLNNSDEFLIGTDSSSAPSKIKLHTGQQVRYEVDASGNHDFKSGTVTFGGDTFIRKDEATLTLSKADTDQYLQLVGGSGTNSDIIAQRTLTLQALNGDIQLASTNSISLDTNATSRYEIDASGNHDFKSGTVTFGNSTRLEGFRNMINTGGTEDNALIIGRNGHRQWNSSDDLMKIWVDDAASYFLINNDSDGDTSTFFFQTKVDGTNQTHLTVGSNGITSSGIINANAGINASNQAITTQVINLQGSNNGLWMFDRVNSADSWRLVSSSGILNLTARDADPFEETTFLSFDQNAKSTTIQTDTNVNGDTNFNGTIRINAPDGNTKSLTLGRVDTNNFWSVNHAGDDFRLYNTASSGSDVIIGLDAGGGEKNNRLGIGITPTEALHVSGNSIVTGTSSFDGLLQANAGVDITGTLTTSGLISSNTGIRAISGADYATLHSYGVEFNRYMNYLRPASGSVKTLRIGGGIKGHHDWGDVYVYTGGTDNFRWNDSVVATHAHVTSEINNTTLQKITENDNTTDRGIVITSGGLDVTGDTHFQNTVDFNGVLNANAGLYITGGSFISNQAQLYQAANLGLVISGQSGSTNDLTIVNSAGNTIMQTPTGSRAANFSSTLSTAGVITANAGINATGHVDITGNYKIGGVSVLTGNTTLQVGSAGGTGAINLATTSGNAISIAGLNSTFNGSITATGQTITASNFAGNWNGKSTSDFIEKPTLSSFFSNERYGLEYYPVANDTSIVSGGWARHLAFKAGKGGTNHAQFGALGHEDSLTYAFIAVQANAYNSANTFRVYEDKVSWGDNDIYHQGNFIAGTDYVSISGNETITGEKFFSSVRFSDFATLNFANRLEIYSSSGSTKLNLLQGNLVVQNNGASTDISINPVSGIISASNFLGNWNGKTDSYFVNTQESQTIFGAKTFNAGLTSHGTGTFNSTLLASGGLIATTGTFTDDIQSNSLIKMLSNGNDGSAMMVFKLASSVDWVYSQKGTGTASGLELKAVDHTNYYHYAAASYFGDSTDESNHLVLDHSLKTASLTGELTATGNVTATDFIGNWNGKSESDFMRTTGNVAETITGDKSFSGHVITMEYDLEVDGGLNVATSTNIGGSARATDFRLMSLNTAPSSSTDTGTTGEIRYTADYIYVCTATNTWKRVALSTW
jgi:hypothetical protein